MRKNKKTKIQAQFASVLVFVLLGTNTAFAEWVDGRGERMFGPDISENEACEYAMKRARKDAIRKVTGEKLTGEDLMVCQEQKDDASCILNRLTWITTDGVIRDIRNKHRQIAKTSTGHQTCVVTLQADVVVAEGKPDPGFDMSVKLNQRTFRDRETLKISVAPTQPMYLTVFQWLPYEKAERQVTRIFPNKFDPGILFKEKGTIPTKANQSKYDMEIRFPKGVKKRKKLVDEYLMLVGTRKRITFRKSFSYEEFNKRLLEIPLSERRTIRKAYNIVSPE